MRIKEVSVDINTELKEFYILWLPVTNGIDSDPI